MDIINPTTPVYNTVIFYIMIICILLIIKPNFMYDYENDQFKSFGTSEGKTMFAFSSVSIAVAILLYLIFLLVETLYLVLE
jgi:hypothetical protein